MAELQEITTQQARGSVARGENPAFGQAMTMHPGPRGRSVASSGSDLPPSVATLRGLLPDEDLVALGAPSGGNGIARRSMWWLRERFQAITDVGLAPRSTPSDPPSRQSLPLGHRAGELSYLAAGDPCGRRILFIHGTPGQAADWTPFLTSAQPAQRRIAVDRLGFGQSGPGAPVAALREQAKAIGALLEAEASPGLLVGSSYGGPVALQAAADYPDLVSGVLLVGSAADPVHERIHPVQRAVAWRPVSRVLPRPLHHSNTELLNLRRELEALGQQLERIRAPVTILQGLRDTLVPPGNAHYLARRLIGSVRLRVKLVHEAGHFLHILRSDLVEDALGELLSRARQTPSAAEEAERIA